MDADINLDSLRELSNSQLEALLKFDSPPETPVQQTDHSILSAGRFQEDLNLFRDYEETNCNIYRNHEQIIPETDCQIDFSILHHSPNNHCSLSAVNMLTFENDLPAIETSLLESIQIPDIRSRNNSHSEDVILSEINEYDNENKCFQNEECNFEEVDEIFKKIEYQSNVEVSYMNRWRHSNSVPRKCHTQLELKPHLDSTHEKLTFSCPARTACRSTHSTISNRNKSSSFFRKNDLEEKLSPSKSKSIDLSNNLPMENKNESNTSSQVCLSFNGILNENMAGVDDIFDKEISGHIFSCSSSSKEQDFSQPSTSPKNSTNLNIMINASSIPFSVKQLYDVVKTNYSDFAFIYALSSQLCQDRVPMECFVTLKIGLLLSLVSIGNNEYQSPIPIVAMTNDTYVTDYLMSNIGQLGSRFLGPVNETKSFSKSNWIEADAIILAGGGVYYAGDWACLKLRRAETIFKSIECSNVPVEKSTLNFSLVTAIWTHWRPNQYRARDQQVFNKFLKIFGIPIFVSDDNHETLIDYTLQQASIRIFESTVDHLSINEEDMRSFLIRVSQINVDLSPEASHLLKAYFVASRSTRQDCLSKQSYIMLKQFAESFAKLSMRKIVLSEDALAAIIMCEHFIENVFGSSVNSPPLFGNFTFVGTVDTYLNQFKLWLDSYIENFTNN